MNRLVVASFLAAGLFARPAAAINLEYGQEYEVAFLQQCDSVHGERACRCSMVALETRVGFERFAEEIERHRDHFFDRSDLRAEAVDLIGRCTAVSRIETRERSGSPDD